MGEWDVSAAGAHGEVLPENARRAFAALLAAVPIPQGPSRVVRVARTGRKMAQRRANA
jgi:hypothetical protein